MIPIGTVPFAFAHSYLLHLHPAVPPFNHGSGRGTLPCSPTRTFCCWTPVGPYPVEPATSRDLRPPHWALQPGCPVAHTVGLRCHLLRRPFAAARSPDVYPGLQLPDHDALHPAHPHAGRYLTPVPRMVRRALPRLRSPPRFTLRLVPHLLRTWVVLPVLVITRILPLTDVPQNTLR